MNMIIAEPTYVPPTEPRSNLGKFLWVMLALVVVALGSGVWYFKTIFQTVPESVASHRDEKPVTSSAGAANVEVVAPLQGGIDRVCLQPGTLEPFEAADLYAKVSGFLMEQSVDIGSRVKKGQVLAKLSVPEYETQVQRDLANVEHMKARVNQMEAQLVAVKAEAKATEAMILLAQAQLKSKSSFRSFRQKQFDRMKELSDKNAIDGRTVDEAQDHFESSLSSEDAAKEAVTTSRLRAEAARAKILQSDADLDEARSQVKVAQADLAKSRVMFSYTEIVCPYNGVITKRLFNVGDFIRSADAGGDRMPLLAVERTDKMRVVVQVPDRDVPFTVIGDKARIEIDALPEKVIDSAVARCSESEDANTRTMRTEIDIPNSDGRLRRGMYGKVTLLLEGGNRDSLTVPSTALSGKSEGHRASIRVVRNGVVRNLNVVTGADNGVRTEIVSGLTVRDRVILRANGPLEEGSKVDISNSASSRDAP